MSDSIKGPVDILTGSTTIAAPATLLPFTDVAVKAGTFTLWVRFLSGTAASVDILFETSQDGAAIDNESTIPKTLAVAAQCSFSCGPNETRRQWSIFATPNGGNAVLEWGVTIQPRGS